MTYFHPAWLEHQRKRYTRADAYRFAAPDTPEAKPPGWLDPSATRVRWKEAQEEEARAAFAAEVKRLQAEQDRLCAMLAEINYEFAWRKLCRKYGYNPDQPRDELGRWTSGANSVGDAAAAGTQDGSGSEGVLSDASPDPIRPGTQYAQNEPRGRPIDLLEEQRLGGHAIEGHVGKSEEFLLARVRRMALDAERDGYAEGFKVGSFSSIEAANKLVNTTVARNSALADLVASGRSGREELDAHFDTPTGYEAYARTERSQPYIRDTYDVRVIIVRDGRAAKGFRVHTAFPGNF